MHIEAGKKVADICGESMKTRKQTMPSFESKSHVKTQSRNKPKVSCSPIGNNHQQEMSVQINQEKMFSSQRTALFTQDMVQALLRRGHSYRFLILQAIERHKNLGLWLSPWQKEPWVMPLSPTPDLPQESTVPEPVMAPQAHSTSSFFK